MFAMGYLGKVVCGTVYMTKIQMEIKWIKRHTVLCYSEHVMLKQSPVSGEKRT